MTDDAHPADPKEPADPDDEILASIRPAPGRRWLGIVSMAGLGVMLVYIAMARPPELGWQVFLLVMGGGALWLADKMRRATERTIELTRRELRDTSGAVIAQVADVQKVDRGFFAFKPSNGFLVRTAQPAGPRAWYPGLWWRAGRQIGIGGVTPGAEAKNAADILSVLVAQRRDEM